MSLAWRQIGIRTGEATNPPASTPDPAYEVKVEDNNILIKKRD